MKILKTHELLAEMRDILTSDTSIESWCVTNYGQKQTVYCGINNEDPPKPDSEYPLLVLFYIERKRSANTSNVGYVCEIGAGIKDGTMIYDPVGSTTFQGLLKVAELRELAELSIARAHFGKIDIFGETSSDIMFPLFSSNSLIEIERPKDYSGPIK